MRNQKKRIYAVLHGQIEAGNALMCSGDPFVKAIMDARKHEAGYEN